MYINIVVRFKYEILEAKLGVLGVLKERIK